MKFIAIPIISSIIFPLYLLAQNRSRAVPASAAPVSTAAPRLLGAAPLRPTNPGMSPQRPSNLGSSKEASLGIGNSDRIAEASLDRKNIGPICTAHAGPVGPQDIKALESLEYNEKEFLVETFFDARAKAGTEKVLGLKTETPPLVRKNDCNGGIQLRGCLELLHKSLSNRHQGNFDNGFFPISLSVNFRSIINRNLCV